MEKDNKNESEARQKKFIVMEDKDRLKESTELKSDSETENYPNVNTKKRLWQIICLIFIVSFLFFSYIAYLYFINYYDVREISQNVISKNFILNKCFNRDGSNKCIRRLIDGVYVLPGLENFFPVAVIIENHVDSRPASGLAQANLVYEAEAEGNITRYLAFYASGEPIKEIGPVRSIRPYFIDWTNELSAVLVHCGGSPVALVKIINDNVYNLNEFYQGKYFWRDVSRPSPHNVYTSLTNVKKYLESNNLINGNFFSWKYKDDLASNLRPLTSGIKIVFKIPDYVVEWKYNPEKNDYLRYLAGIIQVDRDNKEIRAKNIIIEYVEAEVIDEELRLKMNNLGSGKTLICFDGSCQSGEWKKEKSYSRSWFYDRNMAEIEFNAGTTWIEVVRPGVKVDYK